MATFDHITGKWRVEFHVLDMGSDIDVAIDSEWVFSTREDAEACEEMMEKAFDAGVHR